MYVEIRIKKSFYSSYVCSMYYVVIKYGCGL